MPAGRPPLSQPPKLDHGHLIVLWPLISDRGHFTFFTNTQRTQHISPRVEERTNKRGLRLAPNARREKFGHFSWILWFCSCHERVLEQNSYTTTRNADSSSRVGWPGFCVYWSRFLLQQPLPFDRHFSLTVSNSFSSIDCPRTLPFFFFQSHWKSRAQSFCVGFAPKQTKDPLTGAHPHPHHHRATVGSIVVVCVLTRFALPHYVCDLIASQMNMQRIFTRAVRLYRFKLGQNATEAAKKICCAKDKGIVNRSTVARWLKKFCLAYKNLDNQVGLKLRILMLWILKLCSKPLQQI